MTIWRMRTARWIPTATNIHSKYLVLSVFPLQQLLQERASVLRYTYFACLVSLTQYQLSGFYNRVRGRLLRGATGP